MRKNRQTENINRKRKKDRWTKRKENSWQKEKGDRQIKRKKQTDS